MACTLQGGAVLHHMSKKSGLPSMQVCAELNAGASTLGEGDDVERHTLLHSGVILHSYQIPADLLPKCRGTAICPNVVTARGRGTATW